MRVSDIFRVLFNPAELNGSQMKTLDFPIKLPLFSFNIECTISRWKSYWNYALNWSNTPYGIWRIFIYYDCIVHTLFVFKKSLQITEKSRHFPLCITYQIELKISGIPWNHCGSKFFWKPKFVGFFFFLMLSGAFC